VDLDRKLMQRVVERVGAGRAADDLQRGLGLGVGQGRRRPGQHLPDGGADPAALQQQPAVESRLVIEGETLQQLPALQPLGLLHRDVARQHPGGVDLHAGGEPDRQAALLLGHLGQAGQGAADLEQRPA
jgi:hypothetical protein